KLPLCDLATALRCRMPYGFVRSIRQLLDFIFPLLGTTMLVFLRRGFGSRALGLKHLFWGSVALGYVAFSVEPGDIADAMRARGWDRETVQQCADNPTKILYANFSCAQHLPAAHARLSTPLDTTPYMQY